VGLFLWCAINVGFRVASLWECCVEETALGFGPLFNLLSLLYKETQTCALSHPCFR